MQLHQRLELGQIPNMDNAKILAMCNLSTAQSQLLYTGKWGETSGDGVPIRRRERVMKCTRESFYCILTLCAVVQGREAFDIKARRKIMCEVDKYKKK